MKEMMINNYQDLAEEKRRLRNEIRSDSIALKTSFNGIREDMNPGNLAKTALNLVLPKFGLNNAKKGMALAAVKAPKKSSGILNLAIGTLITILLKRIVFRNGGFLSKMVIPLAATTFLPAVISKKLKEKFDLPRFL